MTNNPQTDRIPLTHSIRYAVRGLPEVPNQYGPGTLEPREITLTYRAAPDSQLDRVHAYVAGRVWVDGAELPLLPGGLYGQHYDDGLDGWPEWLAEEARLHEPAAARVVSAAPTQTDLRDRIAEALIAWTYRGKDPEHGGILDTVRANAYSRADAVLAVLPSPADRAAVLLEVADFLRGLRASRTRASLRDIETDLREQAAAARRLADEAQQQECTASISGNCLREAESETACDTDDGECVYGGKPGAEAQQQPDTETPSGCPDPIECNHEAALGQAQQEVRRLGLMVDEYGAGASALTDKLERARDMHRETCILARDIVRKPAFGCSMCEVLDAPAMPVQQADTETQAPAEDPARIDRLRPEFTEHSSIEAIDAQLRRSRSQQRRWHLRTEWLISLRQRRVEQKTRGEWPAPGPGRVADEEQGKTRKACACGQDGCEYCDVPEEPRS